MMARSHHGPWSLRQEDWESQADLSFPVRHHLKYNIDFRELTSVLCGAHKLETF